MLPVEASGCCPLDFRAFGDFPKTCFTSWKGFLHLNHFRDQGNDFGISSLLQLTRGCVPPTPPLSNIVLLDYISSFVWMLLYFIYSLDWTCRKEILVVWSWLYIFFSLFGSNVLISKMGRKDCLPFLLFRIKLDNVLESALETVKFFLGTNYFYYCMSRWNTEIKKQRGWYILSTKMVACMS